MQGSIPYVSDSADKERKTADVRRNKLLAQRQNLLAKKKKNKRLNSGIGGMARSTNRHQRGNGSSYSSPSWSMASGAAFSFKEADKTVGSFNSTMTGSAAAIGLASPMAATTLKSPQAITPTVTGTTKWAPTPKKKDDISDVERNMMSMGITATYVPPRQKSKPTKKAPKKITKDMLTMPLMKGMKMMCNVKRKKGVFKNPVYECYFLERGEETYIMASTKRPKNATSNYIIHMDKDDLMNKDSNGYLGKLRSNFSGTEFIAFDDGSNPKNMEGKDQPPRTELATVQYVPNFVFNRGPRQMTVIVPNVRGGKSRYKFMGEEKGNLKAVYQLNNDDPKLVVLRNKKPKWNPTMNAFCLNFHGRVTKASVKNFQLSDDVDGDSVILQFGKTGKDDFTMDLTYPLSPLQAFAICLSSFDNKKVVD